MTLAEIRAAVRRAINEPRPRDWSDDDIDTIIGQGGAVLWLEMLLVDPEFCETRKILQSNTHIFVLPSDYNRIVRLFDYRGNADSITGASNATPIVITEASHGRSTGDIVVVQDVGGNTGANGTWSITVVDTSTYSLDDSVGVAAYTSGGLVYEPKKTMIRLSRKNPKAQSLRDRYRYYIRGDDIVVDYSGFSYDVVLDYIKNYSEVSDIPSTYHPGMQAYAVINCMKLPMTDSPLFSPMKKTLEVHAQIWKSTVTAIRHAKKSSNEPQRLAKGIHWNAMARR